MRFGTRLGCLGLLAAASAVAPSDTILRQRTLADLSRANDTTVFTRRDCNVVDTGTDSSGGATATLRFLDYYASFGQALKTSQDWSPYNLVRMLVKNHESRTVNFKLIVQLNSDPNSYSNAFTGDFTLKPGETRRYMFHLNVDDPEPFGMEYLRPVLSANYTDEIAGTQFRNLKTIYHWRISNQDDAAATLTIGEFKLIRQNLVFDDMVDAYGQYTDRSWSNKIKQDSDFSARKAEELTDLDANPGPGEMSGTRQVINENPTTGIWKVVKQSSGRYYLQHPSGRLFWSLGVSTVSEGSATPVEGREHYFKYLPSTTGKYARAYMERNTPDGTKLCLSFGMKNLITKYGDSYETGWLSMVKKRLASWGVNTLGIQCDPSLLDGSIPYTLILHTTGFKTRVRPPSMLWGSLPDPYDVNFKSWMTNHFGNELDGHVGRQSFMGVFVDNELSWGSTKSDSSWLNVPRGVLNSYSTQPAKIELQKRMQTKYSSIGSLNDAWNTDFSSWSDFLGTKWLPSSYTSAMKSDLKSFLKAYATKYYSLVNAALNDAGLKSLYLGSRFCDWTPEVVDAAAAYADVLSINLYREARNVDWNYLNTRSKPFIISELGYGTKARGTFGGPAPAFSHGERAQLLKAFLERAVTLDKVVGVHWFCYTDQPVTGRWTDYENAGMGLVDIADNPYPESVDVLRDFTSRMYDLRG